MTDSLNSRDSVDLMRHILENEGVEEEEILKRTPERWVDALRSLMGSGDSPWDFTTFDSTSDGMVIVHDITFSSLCAHHLLPFFGSAHVAYIPDGQVVGLSKIARSVRSAALGLWSQEELCEEIANQLSRSLKPLGVGVVMRAEHTCMTVRGVKVPGATTTTSSMLGVFRSNDNLARSEFMSLIAK